MLTIKHLDNYNIQALDTDGTQHLMHANQIERADLHHFLGWRCHAGLDYVYINEDGEVWGGMCMNDSLGNLSNDPSLLSEPTTCRRDTCSTCADDLSVAKSVGARYPLV